MDVMLIWGAIDGYGCMTSKAMRWEMVASGEMTENYAVKVDAYQSKSRNSFKGVFMV